jgi:hypothetical protein
MAKEPAGLRRWRLAHKKKSKKGVTMARGNRTSKRSYRKKGITIPIGIVAGLAPGAMGVWQRRDNMANALDFIANAYTGVSPQSGKFNAGSLRFGLLPLVAGFAVHKIAGMVGINRALAGAGVPYIRI